MPTLSLPYPVSVNRYWRQYRGRMVVSAEAKQYKSIIRAIATQHGIGAPLGGDIAIEMAYHPRRPKKWRGGPVRAFDLSNVVKIAEDALNGVAWLDDRQVAALTVRRAEPVPDGALVVTWEAM